VEIDRKTERTVEYMIVMWYYTEVSLSSGYCFAGKEAVVPVSYLSTSFSKF